MAWLWESWEEFVREVGPVSTRRASFGRSRNATEMDSLGQLLSAVHDLTYAVHGLGKLGFGNKVATDKPEILHEARNRVIEALYAGEQLLLYHKRLARSEASYGFLHQLDLLEHWDRYASSARLSFEIEQFITDAEELLEGYERMVREDERFIVDDLEVPDELKQDFQLARNLFSIGLDEVGLFVAGRGLEKVLRRIAAGREISFQSKSRTLPADVADLNDLIEIMSRVKWKVRNELLISRDTKALLHYIRTVRNRGAHTGHRGSDAEGLREKAGVIAKCAGQLWIEVATSKAKVFPTTILKDW
jgi:hypothetical protein